MEAPMNNRVRELRKHYRWTQEQFGDLLEVSRQTINSIENGRFDPSLTLALKIATLLEEPVEDIFVLGDTN
jgi:putative transcriptional regulator